MLSILLGLATSLAFANDKVTLQLKWKHQFQFAGFYAAIKEGYYQNEQLDVEIKEVDPAKSVFESVSDGDAQYGISDASIVLSRLLGHSPVIIAAIFQHSPMVLISKADSGIISPLELKNKNIMFRKNVDDAVLLAMFTEMGLKESDYFHIPHNFNDSALITGDVDAMSAYISNQPYYFKTRDIPINIMSPVNYGIDFYGDMIFVDESYLKNNKEQVVAFRRASIKGWAYALNHQQEMVDWILSNLDTTKSREHLLFEAEKISRLVNPDLVEIGYFSDQRLRRIVDIYKQLKMAPVDADIEGINYKIYYLHQSSNWRNIALLILFPLVVALLILWMVNYRLKSEVARRTGELNQTNESLQRSITLINRYIPTWTISADHTVIAASEALLYMLAIDRGQLLGKVFDFTTQTEDFRASYDRAILNLKRGKSWSGELQLTSFTGKRYWIYAEIEPITDAYGHFEGSRGVAVDITDKKLSEQIAITDSLTGLHNRRYLDKRLMECIATATRYHRPLAVVLLDIDYFKSINDTFGHLIGDQVIQELSAILSANVRQSDIVGRWGGEEFLVICPETDLQGAKRFAELLREAVVRNIFSDISDLTCSFGVAEVQQHETINSIIRYADKALYAAKSNGRNRVEVAEHE